MRRQQLFFQSTNGKDFATKGDFARHREIASDRNAAESTCNRGCDGNASRRPIFRNCSLGHVDVNVNIAIEVARQSQPESARTNVRHRGLGRFLHYVAQFAGECQFAFAIDHGRFGAQNGAAHFGPGESCNQADFALFMRQRVAEFQNSQELADILGGEGNWVILAFLHHLAGDFAAYIADLAFEIANSRFARVGADDCFDSFVTELEILPGQASLHHLLLHQKLLGDLDLFLFGVAVQSQDFHAILQRQAEWCASRSRSR